MRIIHVAAEMAPIAKAGGLADAVTGLSKEQRKRHHVSVIVPKHSFISIDPAKLRLDTRFSCLKKQVSYDVQVFETEVEGVTVYLVEMSPLLGYFYEKTVYLGNDKDAERFLYFCKAAAEYLILKKEEIDVLHMHDWHAALLAPLVKNIYLSLKALVRAVVLTVHNLAYTGKFSLRDLQDIHYPLEHVSCFATRGYFFTSYSLMRGALALADTLITVSPGYKKEILTKRYACGFLDLLEERSVVMKGILNGIDEELWNPEKDPHIPYPFSKEMPVEKILAAKENNKKLLRKKLGLEEKNAPLVVCIARLVPQKNPYLMKKGILYAKELKGQGALLGTSSLPKEKKAFQHLSKTYEKDLDIRFITKFDEPLSRLLYAAADFLLMPSNFEPCGLTQLIAMKYGCIPIVHHVGGLKDTVFDPKYESDPRVVNGFYFLGTSIAAVKKTMERAFSSWQKDRCKTLVENGVRGDYSWKQPSMLYEKTYLKIVQKTAS